MSFLRIVASLVFVTLLGRAIGLGRDIGIMFNLGASADTDAVLLMLILPDLLVGILFVGGINAALLPALKTSNHRNSIGLLIVTFTIILGLTLIFAFLSFVAPDKVIAPFAPSLDLNDVSGLKLAAQLLPLLFILFASIAVCNAVLLSADKYLISALTIVFFNLFLVIHFIFVSTDTFDLIIFSVFLSLILGARLLFLAFFAAKKFKPYEGFEFVSLVAFSRIFGLGFLSYGTFLLAPTVFRSMFASGGDGNLSMFNFANKLFEVPMALLAGTIATVLLPYAAGMLAKSHVEFDQVLTDVLSATASISIVGVVGCLLFVEFYIEVLFVSSSLNELEISKMGEISRLMFLGSPFASIALVLITYFYASQNPKAIIRSIVPALIISLLGVLVMQYFFWNTFTPIHGLTLFYILSGVLLSASIFQTRRKAVNFWFILSLKSVPIISLGLAFALFMAYLPSMEITNGLTCSFFFFGLSLLLVRKSVLRLGLHRVV